MGTKNKPGKFDCYENAKPDEPMFIILGRDISGPGNVLFWCLQRARLIMAGVKPGTDIELIEEAYACAIAMVQYKGEKESEVDTLFKQVQNAIATIKSIRATEKIPSVQDSPDRFAPNERTAGNEPDESPDPAGRLAADTDHYD